MGERGRIAGRLEQQHGARRRVLGLVGLAGHEQVPRDAHEALPGGHRVAHLLVQLDGLPARVDRLAEAMGVVELPAVAVEQVGALAQTPGDRRAGAPTRSARAPAGASRRASASRAAAGPTATIVSTSPASTAWCITRASSGCSPACSARTTAALSVRRRSAGRLCSIARRASSCRNARLPGRTSSTPARSASASASTPGPSSSAAASPIADLRRHHREPLERVAALRTEPPDAGQHRLDDAGRHGLARRGQRLGDEERVAARGAVQRRRVGPRAVREPRDGRSAQRREREPVHRRARQRAEELAQAAASSRQVSTSTAPTPSMRRAA